MAAMEHKSEIELAKDTPDYGVSVVRIWEKIDCVITVPHCICKVA